MATSSESSTNTTLQVFIRRPTPLKGGFLAALTTASMISDSSEDNNVSTTSQAQWTSPVCTTYGVVSKSPLLVNFHLFVLSGGKKF